MNPSWEESWRHVMFCVGFAVGGTFGFFGIYNLTNTKIPWDNRVYLLIIAALGLAIAYQCW